MDVAAKPGSDITQNRSHRFVSDLDFQEDISTGHETLFTTVRPFYQGEAVGKRMTEIRNCIIYTRKYWADYDKMLKKLASFLLELITPSSQDPQSRMSESEMALIEAVCTLRSDWTEEASPGYGTLLRLYTSTGGYNTIFSATNRDVFHRDSATLAVEEALDRLRTVVFLVELVNIDLYRLYIDSSENQRQFAATVYRGVLASSNLIAEYRRILVEGAYKDRYIAVPLSLESATLSETIARRCLTTLFEPTTAKKRLLLRIQVINLPDDLLAVYKSRFPDSLVTTICTVPIAKFSEFPEEEEVILRGAFYHLLDLSINSEDTAGTQEYAVDGILDAVVVNSNRDHPSTFQLGEKGDLARSIFGILVSIGRYRFCTDYFRERDRTEAVQEYEGLLATCNEKLAELLSKNE